jgi:hypothetical protein
MAARLLGVVLDHAAIWQVSAWAPPRRRPQRRMAFPHKVPPLVLSGARAAAAESPPAARHAARASDPEPAPAPVPRCPARCPDARAVPHGIVGVMAATHALIVASSATCLWQVAGALEGL